MSRRNFEECVAVVVSSLVLGLFCIVLASALGAQP